MIKDPPVVCPNHPKPEPLPEPIPEAINDVLANISEYLKSIVNSSTVLRMCKMSVYRIR